MASKSKARPPTGERTTVHSEPVHAVVGAVRGPPVRPEPVEGAHPRHEDPVHGHGSTGSPRTGSASTDRLDAALAERDAALAQLADLRAQLDNLRLAARREGEQPLKAYPVSAGVGAPPLRYVFIDQANDTVKSLLGPLHRAVKSLATSLK